MNRTVAIAALLVEVSRGLVDPAAAAPAVADPAAADRAEAEARARAEAKDFVGAARKYREAYAADPRPERICNVGVAYYKAQELPRAQLFLRACLDRGGSLDREFLERVRTALVAIEAALAAGSYTPVEIEVEPRAATLSIAAFEPDETFEGGRTIWLRSGSHRVTARAEGHVDQTAEIDAKDRTPVRVKLVLARRPAAPGAGAGSTASAAAPPRPGARVEAAPPPDRPSIAPAIAASAVTIGLASFALHAARRARDHAERAPLAVHDDAYRAEADQVARWNAIFAVDAALAGAGALVSGYLWYRAARPAGRSIPARVQVTPRRASIALGGRF
jgi:hypothetical protein